MAPITEAKRKADLKYRAAKRKQIVLDYSIEDFERVKAYCQDKNVPVATWCKAVIEKAMKDDREV